MPRPSWANAEETAHLEKDLATFCEHQHKKTVGSFWPRAFQKYEEAFPLPAPTAEELEDAGEDVNKAISTKRLAEQKVRTHVYSTIK